MSTAFEIADRFVADLCDLSPVLATALGVQGRDHEWGDFGVQGEEERAELLRRYQAELGPHRQDQDRRQRLAAGVTLGSIEEQLAGFEAGDHFRDLRHMASSFHRIRWVFDLMPTGTREHWDNIASRLETIDRPYRDYRELLDAGRNRGIIVAKRQVVSVVDQARELAGDSSAFLVHLAKASESGHLNERLEAAVGHARASAASIAQWLETSYLPDAVEDDGVGEDEYRRFANRLVGLDVDPHQAYEWGWEEFHRLIGEMTRIGEHIQPGTDLHHVREFLESDPEGMARSPEELVGFVQRVLEEAVADLAGAHFEVPDEIRPITVQIAPPGGPLAVYYMRPSEDFSRPGGVWYSIGDQRRFPLYQQVSTAYHEAFPGHHLQIATAMYHRDSLSRAQRVLTWYPGYTEGWGMYSEVLMGELGYLDDPKHYFGMLGKQMYRAARVVVDIGLHLSKRIPESSPMFPGEPWTFERAVELMRVYGFRTPEQAEAEVLRYLGWPGQAIAYKLGEREILSIREEARSRAGPGFDLKDFHATVLGNGTMRLDLLREVVRDPLG